MMYDYFTYMMMLGAGVAVGVWFADMLGWR